jgi:hypothetical protein
LEFSVTLASSLMKSASLAIRFLTEFFQDGIVQRFKVVLENQHIL